MDEKLVFEALRRGLITPEDAKRRLSPGGLDSATSPADVKKKFEAGELDRENAIQQLKNVGMENPESLLERRKPLSAIDNISGAAQSFNRGLGFGFADEAAAAVMTPVVMAGKNIMGQPTGLGEAYNESLTEARRVQADFDKAHPVLGPGLTVAGAVYNPALRGRMSGAPLSKALTGMGALENIAVGSLSGAAYGFGEGEGGFQNRLESGGDGALYGAATGILAPAVLNVAGKGVKAVGKGLEVGKRVLVGKDADALFSDIIARSGKAPEQLASEIKAGKISTIADIAGDDVQGLTRSIAKTQSGKDIISDALEGRSEDAVRRVTDHLSQDLSDVGTYFGKLEDIAKARAKMAEPLYTKAFSSNKSVSSPQIDRILSTPAGQSALKQAAVKMQNDMSRMGIPDEELMEQARLVGMDTKGGIAKGLNLRSLDYVKRALDDQIGTAIRAGESDNVRILTGLKNDLVRGLDAADKTGKYAKARQVFGGFSKMEDAQTMGLDFDRMTPEQLRMTLKEMTPDQKDAFRIGVREKLQRIVNSTPDGSDPAKRIFGNTQKRGQLMEIFPTIGKYRGFEKKMMEEINAARTKFRVLGGSRTDFNLGADDELMGIVDDIASRGVKETVLSRGLEWVKRRYAGINEENSRIIAKALVDRKAGIEALEKMIAKNQGKPEASAAKEVLNAIRSWASMKRDAPDPRSPIKIDLTDAMLKKMGQKK